MSFHVVYMLLVFYRLADGYVSLSVLSVCGSFLGDKDVFVILLYAMLC